MKVKVFGCPAVKRELYFLAAFCPNDIVIEIISPELTQQQLQQKIEETDAERIVLALGQRRMEGLHSAATDIIAPKAHDCAHLLIGSADRYRRVFSENDDQPLWLNCGECGYSSSHGNRCAVISGFLPFDFDKNKPSAREYVSDLSLLKSLLDMTFDDTQAVIIPPNSRIISDPVEIISFEPL